MGRFKDLALDLIVREKMKQIRFSMRGWQLWLIEKGNQPNKVFFRGKTNPHTDGNICFQYYIIKLHLFLESFVHPSQMMWWYVTILIRVLGVLQPVCPVSVGVGLASRCHFSKKTTFSNLISKNVLGKSEQKWYQYEGRGWFLWVFAWLGDCAFPIKRCNVTSKPTASVTLLLMFLPQH